VACLEQWQLDFYNARKAQIDADLININACLTALLLTSGVQSYQLNTGQTTQMVTRQSVSGIRTLQKDLQRELYDILALLNGNCSGRTIYVRPGF
jgi:hypothetical protein